MIDLHSHLLPGVDDGSRSVTQSVDVLNRMAAQGITDVCLTPHLEAGRAVRGIPPAHEEAFRQLSASAPASVRLHRGVEMMLDRPLADAAAANRRLTLGGSRFILVEFTTHIAPPAAANALRQLVQQGLTPLLAHPERYACCTPTVVAEWRRTGAVMQVDATTLFMPRTRGNRARALLEHGLADVLAADNHGDQRLLSTAYRLLAEHDALEQAQLLTRGNPAAILSDGTTAPVPPFVIKRPLLSRLKDLLTEGDGWT